MKHFFGKYLVPVAVVSLGFAALAQPAFASALLQQDFNVTDQPLTSYDSNYTFLGGNGVQLSISSNKLSGASLYAYSSFTSTGDQCLSYDVIPDLSKQNESYEIDLQRYPASSPTHQVVGRLHVYSSGAGSIDLQAYDSGSWYLLNNPAYSFNSGTFLNGVSHSFKVCAEGTVVTAYVDGNSYVSGTILGGQTGTFGISLFADPDFSTSVTIDNLLYESVSAPSPTPTPSPTPIPGVIAADPSSASVTVGNPFTVDVRATGDAFNALKADVGVSSNLSVLGLSNPTSGACNLHYTETPGISSLAFAGALFGTSSSDCKVYKLTLLPTSEGTGTVTFTNGSMKAYGDSGEILNSVTNGSYTISVATASPTPTPLPQVGVTSAADTYAGSFTLGGTKDAAISTVFVNASSSGVTYPTSTTWEDIVTLSVGTNTFTIYGSDGINQTATFTTEVKRHAIGDINGDGVVDIIDASLFAVDWGKTSNLTYPLSDMNGDGNVDLTDLSILAKAETQ